MNLLSAVELQSVANGRFVRTTGIVTVRQRPGTAKGIIFVSLEDETGVINVIVRNAVLKIQRKAVLSASLLTVHGIWQRDSGTGNIIAKQLIDNSIFLGKLPTASRDFH